MKLSVARTLDKAKKLAKSGNRAQAAALYQEVLQKFPQNPRARDGLAALSMPQVQKGQTQPTQQQVDALVALLNQGRHKELHQQIAILAKSFPRAGILYNLQGASFAAMERYAEAVEVLQKAIRVQPTYAEAHSNLGNALQSLDKTDAAIEAFKNAIKYEPGFAAAHNNLGNSYGRQGNLDKALECYATALKYRPKYADAYKNQAIALINKGEFELAVDSIEQNARINPKDIGSQIQVANLLRKNERYEEAIVCLDRVLKLDPDNADALASRGNSLAEVGRIEEGKADILRALEIDNTHPAASLQYCTNNKIKEDDPRAASITKNLEENDHTSADEMYLHFAVAKINMDLGDPQTAVQHLMKGNSMQNALEPYDEQAEISKIEAIKAYFENAPKIPQTEPSLPSKPIFVLGMPRSGTTLTEQIISSHSEVLGVGEIIDLTNSVKISGWDGTAPPSDVFKNVRSSYAKFSERHEKSAYITDKTCFNYHWIGFILSALPEAKIVHLVRQPEAVCWSNFSLYFNASGMAFNRDMETLGRYYNRYLDLMEFWREKYPGQFYDLNYEKLTENQEEETRKLYAFLELDWQDAALDFHKNTRRVATASTLQVRNKMYKGSSQKWEQYKPWLTPLLDILHETQAEKTA